MRSLAPEGFSIDHSQDLSSIASAKAEAIRDDLPREVLSYAEGLRRQMYEIARKYGVEKPADIGPKMASGEVSLPDMERMVELKELLETAVELRRLPTIEVRRRKEEAERKFFASLDEIAGVHLLAVRRKNKGSTNDRSKPSSWTPELERAVEEGPMIPPELLFASSETMQEVIQRLESVLPTAFRADSALIASMVVNRAVRGIPTEEARAIRQSVDGSPLSPFLGYLWGGGELTVRGTAGYCLGAAMTGGTILAGEVGPNAGEGMRGGLLRIDNALPSQGVGAGMRGGEININVAGHLLGDRMRDGLITAGIAGDSVGTAMYGGEIRVLGSVGASVGDIMTGGTITTETAGNLAGERMRGGTLRIGRATGEQVGFRMSGGTIELGSGDVVGPEMSGGTITVGTAENVGPEMSGGTIVVETFARYAGTRMVDGEIIIRGTAEHVGIWKVGGKIRREGP